MMDSTSLPPPSQAMTWNAVANLGTVRPKVLPNGLVRYWIDFGRRGGKRVRLYSVPSAADRRPIALANREMAQQVLDAIRAEVRNGRTLDQVLATAILDRLLHRCHVLNISGRSYRLRDLERAAAATGGRG